MCEIMSSRLQKIGVSVLFAFAMEASCIVMMMSGGVFFGPLAYFGVGQLWPSGLVSNFLVGDGGEGFGLSLFLAFLQFYVLSWLFVTKLTGRNVANPVT